MKTGKAEKQEAAPSAAEVTPELSNVMTTGLNTPNSASGFSIAKTDLTTNSNTVGATTLKAVNADLESIKLNLKLFPQSASELVRIQTTIGEYFSASGKKPGCTSNAETASFVCLEGSSPGMKAAKLIMDVGGPVITAISSAQKACSTSAKVTSTAGSVLTVAKGVCVAAKTMCDMSCSGAVAYLGTLDAQLAKFKVDFSMEVDEVQGMYCSDPLTAAMCIEAGKSYAAVLPLLVKASTSLAAEKVPAKPGTTAFLAAKCTGYAKEVALFAVNIANMAMAKKGASDCEEKLSSSGTSGTISAIQYCETPGNANTQFCICKSNDNQPGCAGYKTGLNDAPKLTDDENGTDTKNSGEGHQFAGGFANKGVGGGFGINSGEMVNAALADEANKDKKAEDQKPGSLTATGGFGGGGAMPTGGSGGAGDVGLDGKVKVDPDKKKWSFGAFTGGFGGSGGSSGRAGSQNKLGEKEMDAIKRKIASDEFRAQVSESSGKSNWEKVRAQYTSKTPTFLLGK